MIISFNRYNGGGSGSGSTDLTNYWNSAVTEQHIESAASEVYSSAVSYTDAALADISLDGYYTSGQTDAAIALAVAPFYTSAQTEEAITDKNYVTSAETEEQILSKNYTTSAETKVYVDSAVTGVQDQIDTMDEVVSQAILDINDRVDEISASTPDLSNYALSADVETLSAATSGKADAVSITENRARTIFPKWNSQGIITGEYAVANMGDLRVNGTNKQVFFFGTGSKIATFYAPLSAGTAGEVLVSTGNGAPVWSAVTMPDMSEYWTSAQTEDAISTALIPYYTSAQTNTAISAATQDMVTSTDVRHIVKLTQAEYDQLATKDPYTFYIIINN